MTLGLVRAAGARPELEPYPGSAGSLSEDILIRGYALAERPPTEAPCVCGGIIDATYLPIPAAVASHNASPGHRAWRAAREDR